MTLETTAKDYDIFSNIEHQSLMPVENAILENSGKILKFKKKEIIYDAGEKSLGAYFVIKGLVKMFQINPDGREQILFFFSEDEAFGYRPLLSNTTHSFSATCTEDTEIKFIDADAFLKLVDTSAMFAKNLLKSLSYEFAVFGKRMNIYAQKGIKERLAFALLLLNEKYKTKKSKSEISNIVLSRTDLAAFVGTSVDVITRNLNYYIDNKLVRVNGKSIFILEIAKLYQNIEMY